MCENPSPDISEELRRHIIDEYEEEQEFRAFQEQRPDMWQQMQRLNKLIEYQRQLPEQEFPAGSCFVHVSLPSTSSFCLRQVMEVDLESCLATLDIHGDEQLEDGIVLVPLENIIWFGFPRDRVLSGPHIAGFQAETDS